MGSWRSISERFDVDDEIPLRDWSIILDACIKLWRGEPSSLAKVGFLSFNTAANTIQLNATAIQILKADFLVFTEISAGAMLSLKGASGDAE